MASCRTCATKRGLARPWAIPGTPGLEHRIGGLEKQDGKGNVSYLPENHQRMTDLRRDKVARIAQEIAPVEPHGADSGKLLGRGLGRHARRDHLGRRRGARAGHDVASVHLRHLNPFAANLGDVMRRFEKVLVAELNIGQLSRLLRAEYLVPAESLHKVQGQPFKVAEVRAAIERLLGVA